MHNPAYRAQVDVPSISSEAIAESTRILLVAPQPFFSERGTPIAVRLLAQTLCEIGYKVDLLTYPLGEDVAISGMQIHRCLRVPGVRSVGIGFSLKKVWLDVSLTASLFRLARKGRYSVIHAVEEAIYPVLALRWRHGASVIYDMDSSLSEQLLLSLCKKCPRFISRLLEWLERWAIRRADTVIAMCDALGERATAVKGAANVDVIPDVPITFDGSEERVESLADYFPPNYVIALYVGNLEPYQGIDLLLEAAAGLPVETRIGIVVVGGSAPEVDRYTTIADKLHLRERVRFLGKRPLSQLDGLLQQADILLSPRTMGRNTPLKIYSYMNSGRAILATSLRTHTQVLDDATAMLAPPTPQAFAAALLALAESQDLRERLGMAARQRVQERYSVDAFRTKLRKAYAPIDSRAHRGTRV